MHKLLYVSSTRQDFPNDELQSILRQSRDNNHRRDVTGLLLYIDGGFLQVLEGDRTALHDLYALIAKDTRHRDAKVLLDEEAPRNFGRWSMGFRAVRPETSEPGLAGITKEAVRGLIRSGGAKRILEILIQTFQSVQGADL